MQERATARPAGRCSRPPSGSRAGLKSGTSGARRARRQRTCSSRQTMPSFTKTFHAQAEMQLARVWVPLATRSQVQRCAPQIRASRRSTIGATRRERRAVGGPTRGAGPRARAGPAQSPRPSDGGAGARCPIRKFLPREAACAFAVAHSRRRPPPACRDRCGSAAWR